MTDEITGQAPEIETAPEPSYGSATDNIGPHLLGRIPASDVRDWSLEEILDGGASALDLAFQKVQASSGANTQVKAWIAAAQPLLDALQPGPAPTPGPTPTPTPVPPAPTPAPDGGVWADTEAILDQGQTPHCIGFGGAQYGNTLPVDDHYVNADGHRIYYEAKVVDGEPKAEDGSSVHSLAKVLKTDGRIAAYAWANTTDAITAYIEKYGPVIVGTDWYNDMFNPDSRGFLNVSGGIAGGHCYLLAGYTADAGYGGGGYYTVRNSWGESWGVNGTAKIAVADFGILLAAQGEALAAVELPATT